MRDSSKSMREYLSSVEKDIEYSVRKKEEEYLKEHGRTMSDDNQGYSEARQSGEN